MIRYQEIVGKPWYIVPKTDLFVLSDGLCCDNVWAVRVLFCWLHDKVKHKDMEWSGITTVGSALCVLFMNKVLLLWEWAVVLFLTMSV
jgi:hypothetical protein